ncbi:unnamed protein product [Protopolystoma xenopodis]|uniref:Uncharacterized protein n=1 Tax=Protopolystoma xenopodis TaxID=117903 RepID=A0A3S5AF11_9PLAT|nr:unnamed protein product [Protopolystoma xenopodis]
MTHPKFKKPSPAETKPKPSRAVPAKDQHIDWSLREMAHIFHVRTTQI